MGRLPLLVFPLMVACASGESVRSPVAKPTTTTHLANPGCDVVTDAPTWRAKRATSTGVGDALSCSATLANLEAVAALVPEAGPIAHAKPWDRKLKPQHLDLVGKRYGLDASEIARLSKDGFAVFDRLSASRYDTAYRDIHRSQLPVYVTVDSILHAVFVSHDRMVADLERMRLLPMVRASLREMHCSLASVAWDDTIVRDVDLYLTVARRLLGEDVRSARGESVEPLVSKIMAGQGVSEIELFGRTRVVDFTRFTPRGHYVEGLEGYFRAMTWLSRLELNLVSRSSRSSSPVVDPLETPREAALALALSSLAEKASVLGNFQVIDDMHGLLAGKREDVSLGDLAGMHLEVSSIEATGKSVREAIGAGHTRTAATHFHAGDPNDLPVVATLVPPRIVGDVPALAKIAAPFVVDRGAIGAADVAHALGHDRASRYLTADLAHFPGLAAAQPGARAAMAIPSGTNDLYDAWLAAVRGVAQVPDGTLPSFMHTEAHADLRMATAIAGYAQIRHANVLVAAQVSFANGCEIPDGWVEEAPATYDALIEYARRGASLAKLHPDAGEYFARLGHFLEVLRTIQRHELEGRALTDHEKHFLAMVAEILPNGYKGPLFRGWYYELLAGDQEAKQNAAFIADFASGEAVSYAGVSGVRLGLFVVDAGGPPRLMVGPVAATFEAKTNADAKRFADADVPLIEKSAPWSASHVVPAPAIPSMKIVLAYDWDDDGRKAKMIVLTSEKGPIVVEPLDHHKQPISRLVRTPKDGEATFALGKADAEQLRVTVAGHRANVVYGEGDPDVYSFGPGLPAAREDGTWIDGSLGR